jgi:predicted nucleic acid-binding protein
MPLVLIDSSVWIDYYQPGISENLKSAVRELIEADEAAINGIIAVEVLQGTANDTGYQKVLRDMTNLKELVLDWNVFKRAAQLGFDLRRQGISIPTIDTLIAATALDNKVPLWHQDNHYELIAEKTGLKTKNWLNQ